MPIRHHTHKRTVRCGYCRQPGHNKSSCPTYAERIEDMRREYGSDYWIVAKYDEKKVKRKASGNARKCSYCHQGGHNRKTCKDLKSHMDITRAKNVEYRKRVFQAMVHHGIFTGAIVKSNNHTRYDRESDLRWCVPMVITQVMWSDINLWESEYRYFSNDIKDRPQLKAKPICELTTKYASPVGFPLDYDLLWNKITPGVFELYCGDDPDCWYVKSKDTYFTTVVSRVNAEKPPLGWLTCEDAPSEKALKEFYKNRVLTDTCGDIIGDDEAYVGPSW